MCNWSQKEDAMQTLSEAISAKKQTAIKAAINVTDDLLQQLKQRHLLTLEDVIYIEVYYL